MAEMHVLSEFAMKTLMSNIVAACHELTDPSGQRIFIGTIPEGAMRMAAITAVQIATGEPVWPGDRQITVRRERTFAPIFREEG